MARRKRKPRDLPRPTRDAPTSARNPQPVGASSVAIGVSLEQVLGHYANVAVIKHAKREFVFDFLFATEPSTVLAARVITSPAHAKDIHRVLGVNIERYEKTFGSIPEE
ncbi:MAG TPA: DUF3467 domain-containing protein [Phycisphaerae bacterium]|nr:DUF3467 domain-containing protein [Phycisphaerae bacterium]